MAIGTLDVFVAVVRLKPEAVAQITAATANNYELLLLTQPGCSNQYEADVLPRLQVPQDSPSIAEDVLEKLHKATRHRFRRAVEVPLWTSRSNQGASTSGVQSMSALVFVPLSVKEGIPIKGAKVDMLARVLDASIRESDSIELQTRFMLRRLHQWLMESPIPYSTRAALFLRPPSCGRVITCSHNPSYGTEEQWNCKSESTYVGTSTGTSEIDHQVVRGNSARLRMIGYEKFEIFVMNPIFGTGLQYRLKEEAPEYHVRGVTENRQKPEISSNDDFSDRFPLHRAAYKGDAVLIEQLLQRGCDPNEEDSDSWTPLQYAAFYGHLDAARALIQTAATQVNAQNKGGATALHFATINARVYMVELLLSHPKIELTLRNKDGKRAVDLCRDYPSKEYQKVAKLLEGSRAKKIQVDFVDLSNLMIELVAGSDTTAEMVLHKVAKEYRIPHSAVPLFAVWVQSENLALQLKADHRIVVQMNAKKWREKVLKWGGDSASASWDVPKLFVKRNAMCSLEQEQQAVLNERALCLLYEEARQLFLKGFYPCNEQDSYVLAAITLMIVYGGKHKLSEPNLKVILPAHRIEGCDKQKAIQQINKEYKLLTNLPITSLQQKFLKLCWTLYVYGSTFFRADAYMNKPFQALFPVEFGINDYGVHLINAETRQLCNTYALKGLSWTYTEGKSYIEMKSKANNHAFRIATPQAVLVHNLLKKLCARNG